MAKKAKAVRTFDELARKLAQVRPVDLAQRELDAFGEMPPLPPEQVEKSVNAVMRMVKGDKSAPLECIECGSASGPMHPIDGDHAGWVCPKCFKKLKRS